MQDYKKNVFYKFLIIEDFDKTKRTSTYSNRVNNGTVLTVVNYWNNFGLDQESCGWYETYQ